MSANYLLRTISRNVLNFRSNTKCILRKHIVPKCHNLRLFSSSGKANDEKIKITFIMTDGERVVAEGKVNDSILDVVIENDLNIDEFGACEGTLTCSTCHVILKKEDYDRIPNAPLDEERDMLDLAYGLTETSRLGCQILLTKELEGLEVRIPEGVNDAR